MIRIDCRLAVAAMAAAFVAAPASAQSAGDFMANPAFADPPPKACDTSFDMQHCAAHDLRVADAEMSANYKALRAKLGQAARGKLLVEQRRWLKARDRDCLAKGRRQGGGTMAPVTVAHCWVEVTRARSQALAARR